VFYSIKEMSMLSLIILVADLVILGITLYNWKRFGDKIFLLTALLDVLATLVAVGNLIGRIPSAYAILALVSALIMACFADWRVFKDKTYLWYMGFLLVATLTGFYVLIARVDFSLPIQDWSISAYISAFTFVGLIIATFVI
jgi:hypothetical protein